MHEGVAILYNRVVSRIGSVSMTIKMRTWSVFARLGTLGAVLFLVEVVGCSPDGAGVTFGGGAGGAGTIAPGSCTPGARLCYENTWRYVCGDDGETPVDVEYCTTSCVSGECALCKSGDHQCDGNKSMVCSDGIGWTVMRDCSAPPWNTVCGATGYCADGCGNAEYANSNMGCEYWPTPLANDPHLNPAYDFRVVVGNPGDEAARVVVVRGSATLWDGAVAPRGLQEIRLPWIEGQSKGLVDSNWKSLFVTDGAYRLRSSLPVTVAQFNPFEYTFPGAGEQDYSFTNDASLLLPTHVLTGDYVNAAYPPMSLTQWGDGNLAQEYPRDYVSNAGYMALVGISDEPTWVHVQVSGHTAGDFVNFGNTPPGEWIHFQLAQGQVAHVASAPPPLCDQQRPHFAIAVEECAPGGCVRVGSCYEGDYDLTGSRVIADRPIAAFGGHVCAYVPFNVLACDHLEVQLPPVQSWGKQYVTKPMVDGSVSGQNLVRIIAAFDGTAVTVDPPQSGIGSGTLDASKWVEFLASTPFSVNASNSIMVAQYLLGQEFGNPKATRGDPAMTVLIPFEQFRSDYVFVAPNSYNVDTRGQNYLLITRTPGTNILFDGGPVSAMWQWVAGRELATYAIQGGTHMVTGDSPFGVIVYGLGITTSYVYPAGLNFEQISVGIR